MSATDPLEQAATKAQAEPTGDNINALFRKAEPHVRLVVRRAVQGDPGEIDDIVQKALLRVFERLETWDPERGTFATWVAVVARTAAKEHYRREARQDALQQALETQSSDISAAQLDHLAQIDDAALIQAAHKKLKEQGDLVARQVLAAARDLVYYAQPISTAVIARQAAIDESAARRALIRLRSVITELEEK